MQGHVTDNRLKASLAVPSFNAASSMGAINLFLTHQLNPMDFALLNLYRDYPIGPSSPLLCSKLFWQNVLRKIQQN